MALGWVNFQQICIFGWIYLFLFPDEKYKHGCPYAKDALFAGEWGTAPGPEEDMGFPTCDNGVGVSRVKLHH